MIALVQGQLAAMQAQLGEMRDAITRLADSYQKLSLLEERQVVTRESLERAFEQIDKLSTRVQTLEREQPINSRTTGWVEKAAGLILAAVIGGAVVSYLPQRAARDANPPAINGRP